MPRISVTVEPPMSSHPCDTREVAFQDMWLLIGGSFVYKMSFWGMAKWPPVGGWLLIRVTAHSRFYCTNYSVHDEDVLYVYLVNSKFSGKHKYDVK